MSFRAPSRGHREVESPAQVKCIMGILDLAGDVLDLGLASSTRATLWGSAPARLGGAGKGFGDSARLWASWRAIMVRSVTWPVKALVEATPISGPAWI